MEFCGKVVRPLVDRTLQKRHALDKLTAIVLGHLETPEEISMVCPPMVGILTSVVEFALRFMKGRRWVDWPTARPTLCSRHFTRSLELDT